MAGSLFDQLKKSGLVNEHKAKQIKREKYQQSKQPKGQKDAQAENDAARLVAEAARLKAEKDRQLNLERQQQQAERAKQAELKQILQSNQLKGFGGEISFNFVDNKQVKTLQVNPATHQRLASGKIRIASLEGEYVLIPDTAVEKVERRDPSVLIPFTEKDDSIPQEDQDYYAKFEIPDDLVW
jgi:uncharacterized protein YaiL (DUF2058 family)